MQRFHDRMPHIKFETVEIEADIYAHELSLDNPGIVKQDLAKALLPALRFMLHHDSIGQTKFASLLFQFFQIKKLLLTSPYFKDLKITHLENLYEIFSWTANDPDVFVMDRCTMVRAFLFCRVEDHRLAGHFTLAEYIDYIYAHKELLKGNLALHLQPEVDSLLQNSQGPSHVFTLDGGRIHDDKSYGLLLMLNVLNTDNKRVIHYPVMPPKKIIVVDELKQALSSQTDLLFYTPSDEQQIANLSRFITTQHHTDHEMGQGWYARKVNEDLPQVQFFKLSNPMKKYPSTLAHPSRKYHFLNLPDYRLLILSPLDIYEFKVEDDQAPTLLKHRELENKIDTKLDSSVRVALFNDRYAVQVIPHFQNGFKFSEIYIKFIDCEQHNDHSTCIPLSTEVQGHLSFSCFPSLSNIVFKNMYGHVLSILNIKFSDSGEIINTSYKVLKRTQLRLDSYHPSADGYYAMDRQTFCEQGPHKGSLPFHPREFSAEFADKFKDYYFKHFLPDNRMVMSGPRPYTLFLCDPFTESLQEFKLPLGCKFQTTAILPEGDVLLLNDNLDNDTREYLIYRIDYPTHIIEAFTAKTERYKMINLTVRMLPPEICMIITQYTAPVSMVGLFALRQRQLPATAAIATPSLPLAI